MLDLAIGVVGHESRRTQAEHLAATVQADYLSVDDGTLGCTGNHIRVWQQLARSGRTWSVVLEDDAQPCDDFIHQLDMALTAAPAPIVSLYLGTSRPASWQPRIQRAILEADKVDASYICAPVLLHAVAFAVRSELITDMLNHLPPGRPIDNAISEWARSHGICYTHGSLVDHADGPTLVKHTYATHSQPRKAWRTTTRSVWTSTTVAM